MRNTKLFSKFIYGTIIWLSSLGIQSCNFLDIEPYITDMTSLDTVFQKKEQTLRYLYNVYSYIPNMGKEWNDKGKPWVAVSDECFMSLRTDGWNANYFANNIMDAGNATYSFWKSYYQGIRSASVFLKRVYECKELNALELKYSIGEAQFLRAYYYFELMKQYGPITLVPEDGIDLNAPIEELLMPRNTWDECVDYVAEELKKAALNLPPTQLSVDFGKPTSGAAYAVLSRLLLYNASPLFNGNTSYADFRNSQTGEFYISQEYQEEKWAKAAAAARQVINSGQYELFTVGATNTTAAMPKGVMSDPSFYKNYPEGAAGIDAYLSYINQFNGTVMPSDNREIIFGMPGMPVARYMSPLRMGGWSCFNIPQKLVDAYYMYDGASQDNPSANYPANSTLEKDSLFSGYLLKKNVHSWYLNREMRFYATVGFNGSFYYGTSTTSSSAMKLQSYFYKGGNCTPEHYTTITDNNARCMTGYLCRKFQHPEDSWSSGGVVKAKVWIDYRLAEIYMNYVEALNELTVSYTIDGESYSRDKEEIVKYFNLVRHRAGLPGVTISDAADPERIRQLIRRERQIEFAWEGLRYFDVRRWKIAETEENTPVRGMDVSKVEPGYYTIVDVKEVAYAYKAFTRRKNFWPIPQAEVIKNRNLDQNPGW